MLRPRSASRDIRRHALIVIRLRFDPVVLQAPVCIPRVWLAARLVLERLAAAVRRLLAACDRRQVDGRLRCLRQLRGQNELRCTSHRICELVHRCHPGLEQRS